MDTEAAFDFVVDDNIKKGADDDLIDFLDWIRTVSGKIVSRARNKGVAINELNKLRRISYNLAEVRTLPAHEIGQDGLMMLFFIIERSKKIGVLRNQRVFPIRLFANSSPKEAIEKTLSYLKAE